MQILVGTSNDSQKLDAKQWLCHICRQAFLNELEIWITNRESTWGSCRAFAEIVLLPGRRRSPRPHNQIDLLICFEDRVAHCELKGFSSYQDLDLGRVRSQVNGERDWLKSVLSDGGFWISVSKGSLVQHEDGSYEIIPWTRWTLTDSEILLSRSTDDVKTWSNPIDIDGHPGFPRDDNGAVEGSMPR